VISKIIGALSAVDNDAAYIDAGGLVYQVLVPANIRAELAVKVGSANDTVSLYTIHYIEGGIAMGTMVPRLIGFLTREDRDFFRLFTSVQGVGVKKALRALVIPTPQIVKAIQTGNKAVLTQLPEIGRKTAERVISELKEKLPKFVEAEETQPEAAADSEVIEEARQLLVSQLQYTKNEADAMIAQVTRGMNDFASPQELLTEVFKRKYKG